MGFGWDGADGTGRRWKDIERRTEIWRFGDRAWHSQTLQIDKWLDVFMYLDWRYNVCNVSMFLRWFFFQVDKIRWIFQACFDPPLGWEHLSWDGCWCSDHGLVHKHLDFLCVYVRLRDTEMPLWWMDPEYLCSLYWTVYLEQLAKRFMQESFHMRSMLVFMPWKYGNRYSELPKPIP